MLFRLAIFATLITYTWFSVLKIILIRKEIRRMTSNSSNLTKLDIVPYGNWSPSNLSIEETELDFSQLEYRDILVLFCFFIFTYYVADIWREWLHIIYRIWEPAINMNLERPNRVEEDDD